MGVQDHSHSIAVSPDDYLIADPRLPPEIEYEIFMISCLQDPKSRSKLLLVSRRLHTWLIPIIYEVITISYFTKINHPPLKSLQRYGHHVKHILFSNLHDYPHRIDEGTVLKSCPNVSNIAFWHGSTPPKELFDLPLKRLSLHTFSPGFEDQIQDIKKTDKGKYREWCSRITHIAWGSVTLTACQSLSALAFPNLTHFLFGDWSGHRQGIVNYVVGSCRHLEVLVILLGKTGSETKGSYVHDSLEGIVFEDVRVVVMRSFFVTDWVKGTKGEHDLWRVAEQRVKERRKPKVVSG